MVNNAIDEPPDVCAVSGCGRPFFRAGLCTEHHRRMRRGLEVNSPIHPRRKYEPDDVCSIEGCGKKPKGRGMCALHHKRSLDGRGDAKLNNPGLLVVRNGDRCAVLNCDRHPIAKNLCALHYKRSTFDRDLEAPLPPPAALGTGRWLQPSGYVNISVPVGTPGSHVRGRKSGSRLAAGQTVMAEHRYVMQVHLGRPLAKGETVHHRDGIRHNNDPSNLELKIGAHSRGINLLDGVFAWLDALERYVGLDLIERAALASIREKASKGLLGATAPAKASPRAPRKAEIARMS